MTEKNNKSQTLLPFKLNESFTGGKGNLPNMRGMFGETHKHRGLIPLNPQIADEECA